MEKCKYCDKKGTMSRLDPNLGKDYLTCDSEECTNKHIDYLLEHFRKLNK